MAGPTDVEYFARLVEALDPWLDQVVIIGGWAHRLYRLQPPHSKQFNIDVCRLHRVCAMTAVVGLRRSIHRQLPAVGLLFVAIFGVF
jgi:hypothetical protein